MLNTNSEIIMLKFKVYEMILRGKHVIILFFCYSLAVAGNKSTTWPPLPPPECGGEWKETGRNRWVGIRAV